eukprot:CAMPEP_0168734520 /NCGR_PEP_ID=MMETSP0724-20121128/8856_1 /TAXON_ID=265536 /ORGANISM="Amphiprora sp., Strain CCMP467" /LENGTH=395 /DNA_ID=CAMNT_0008781627 /DNA_START=32 /DNA_END=1219 /DNA_ORIENTATION=-
MVSPVKIGTMNKAYFISRQECLDFINSLLGLKLTHLDQVACSGAVATQLFALMFYFNNNNNKLHAESKSRSYYEAMQQHDALMQQINWIYPAPLHIYEHNYRVLQSAFKQQGLVDQWLRFPKEKLMLGRPKESLEFCQFLHGLYYQNNNHNTATDYNPAVIRSMGRNFQAFEQKYGNGTGPVALPPVNSPPRRVKMLKRSSSKKKLSTLRSPSPHKSVVAFGRSVTPKAKNNANVLSTSERPNYLPPHSNSSSITPPKKRRTPAKKASDKKATPTTKKSSKATTSESPQKKVVETKNDALFQIVDSFVQQEEERHVVEQQQDDTDCYYDAEKTEEEIMFDQEQDDSNENEPPHLVPTGSVEVTDNKEPVNFQMDGEDHLLEQDADRMALVEPEYY